MTALNIMVIGAGQMGGGIAQVMAAAGHRVHLHDLDAAALRRGLTAIAARLAKAVSQGKLSNEAVEAQLANLTPTGDLAPASQCDLVVEAVVEDMAVKGDLFQRLDRICPPQAILASNTSSLPITEIAGHTDRPEQVVGMHFMNPVPVMALVEIIRGLATSNQTYAAVRELALSLGKTPVEVRDVPGFVSNRVLQMLINEAAYCVYEGVASVEDIDTVLRLGMNHPMGPLTLADFIGLDTVLSIMEILQRGYGDSKYRPCPLLRQYVQAGWLGRKSGRGFYRYDQAV
ncbi:MAG: 3-hydroxybutyryl-CoA dehydrogenase [Propionibacteriaceae bacterium]|jgi:3-hydroxybutyryl-CoA dehydrogenase|nr:3-hydroxybutyryl-CoA dehydrogenase [Propionibacteriaceae bacterium]